MPRQARMFTALQVAKAKPGTYFDGAGLMLVVGASSASWMLRYTHAGKRRELGLGSARGSGALPLAQARAKAEELRAQVRAGHDPLASREILKAAREAAAAHTFAVVAQKCFDARQAQWSNGRHKEEWLGSLQRYVIPHLGQKPIEGITTEDILKVLKPIWNRIPETASRVRQRLETVFSYAAALKLRPRHEINPAAWRGNLAELLPSPKDLQRRKQETDGQGPHYPSLPWEEVPAFLEALGKRVGMAPLALRFAILTAARSGEVRGMTWREVDLEQALWTIPAARMKGRKLHAVPLSEPALAVLRQVRPLALRADGMLAKEVLVFPGARSKKPLSDMALSMLVRGMAYDGLAAGMEPRWSDPSGQIVVPHGFRSSFKEWCRSHGCADELSELALAHRDANSVRAAYARATLIEERRPMMAAWAQWCGGEG